MYRYSPEHCSHTQQVCIDIDHPAIWPESQRLQTILLYELQQIKAKSTLRLVSMRLDGLHILDSQKQ